MARDYGTLNNIDVEKIDQLKADAFDLFNGDVTFSDTSEDANTVDYEVEGSLSANELILVNRLRLKYAKVRPDRSQALKNVSMKLEGNVLYLKDAAGEDFAKDSPGALRMPSVDDAGHDFIAHIVSTGPSLTESALTGVEWGTNASRIYDENYPVGIYAINLDDTNGGVAFFASAFPVWDAKVSPADTGNNYGTVSALPTDTDAAVFVCLDGSESNPENYAEKPMVCLGVLYAQKSGANVWAFEAMDENTGAGGKPKGIWFDIPKGHFGGKNGSHWDQSGVMTFTSETFKFNTEGDGVVGLSVDCNTRSGNGSSSSNLKLPLPYLATRDVMLSASELIYGGNERFGGKAVLTADTQGATIKYSATNILAYDGFSSGSDEIHLEASYLAYEIT
jgi:hypothetical protein